MYLGRIVAVGMNDLGKAVAMYRVSSRSFPNREAVLNKEAASVVPRAGFEDDLRKNPYISYNCVRFAGDYAVVSNGSHTDPVAEKIASGLPVRDAFVQVLLAMDFEHDSLDTPRIVGAVSRTQARGYLGIVRKDALLVREFDLRPGEVHFLSTYEMNRPSDDQLDRGCAVHSAAEACSYVIGGGVFASFSNAVTAAAVLAAGDKFEVAVQNA